MSAPRQKSYLPSSHHTSQSPVSGLIPNCFPQALVHLLFSLLPFQHQSFVSFHRIPLLGFTPELAALEDRLKTLLISRLPWPELSHPSSKASQEEEAKLTQQVFVPCMCCPNMCSSQPFIALTSLPQTAFAPLAAHPGQTRPCITMMSTIYFFISGPRRVQVNSFDA